MITIPLIVKARKKSKDTLHSKCCVKKALKTVGAFHAARRCTTVPRPVSSQPGGAINSFSARLGVQHGSDLSLYPFIMLMDSLLTGVRQWASLSACCLQMALLKWGERPCRTGKPNWDVSNRISRENPEYMTFTVRG